MPRKKQTHHRSSRHHTSPSDLSILLVGSAGQGIMTIEKILTTALRESGYYVFATRTYMSRVRGGANSTLIRVSPTPVTAPVERVDIFAALNTTALDYYAQRIKRGTVVLGDQSVVERVPSSATAIELPFRQIAADIGDTVYANSVAAGAIMALLDVEPDAAYTAVHTLFDAKGPKIVDRNVLAVRRGYKQGSHAAFLHDVLRPLARADRDHAHHRFLTGAEAVALGALAGGADFCTSYPMSPSTGVLTHLAQYGEACGMVVEQATDEIGAINMSVGASYAGARPIITTSGGGFALMEEAISLAAMTETPVTIHVAQRPGPATGLPTRTAQEDLNLVLHAGHGEFARAIYAPGDHAEAFALSQRALAVAAQYQIPTFLLTDQYFMDTLLMTRDEDFVFEPVEKHIVSTTARYARYTLTDDGISPRGVPGYGDGFVCADSDEHDESGHITEDLSLRVTMVDKRRRRLRALAKTAIMPTRYGARGAAAKRALIVWGSNKCVAREALDASGATDVTVLHFSQLYPLHPRVAAALKKFTTITVAENNATGQFADLLMRETAVTVHSRITRYDGSPFTVEELAKNIAKR